MSPLEWFKKEKPLFGLTGLWGGVGSNLVAGLATPVGQWERVSSGTQTFTVPDGVKSISVVCVGGGGGGGGGGPGGGAGGGGALAYRNDIAVSGGQTYQVYVASGGSATNSGGTSYINGISGLTAYGGQGGTSGVGQPGGNGGTSSGQGGGQGGKGGAGNNGGGAGGGPGAGSYNGAGAKGGECGTDGSHGTNCGGFNGANGGGASGSSGWGNNSAEGGGTLPYGEGTTVQGQQARARTNAGEHGEVGSLNVQSSTVGGNFQIQTQSTYKVCKDPGSGGMGNVWGSGFSGGEGAVRIIWPGDERQFPSTRTIDETE